MSFPSNHHGNALATSLVQEIKVVHRKTVDKHVYEHSVPVHSCLSMMQGTDTVFCLVISSLLTAAPSHHEEPAIEKVLHVSGLWSRWFGKVCTGEFDHRLATMLPCAEHICCTISMQSSCTKIAISHSRNLLQVATLLAQAYSQTTSENIATCRLRHDLTSSSSTSKTSHCLALKKVDGPTGGPRAGDTTNLRFPPTLIVLIPFSKPASDK